MNTMFENGGDGAPALEHGRWLSTLADEEKAAIRREAREGAFREVYALLKRAEKEQVARAKGLCEAVFYSIRERLDFECRKVFLRVRADNHADAIFFFDEDVYLSDAIDQAFDIAWEVADKARKEGYRFNAQLAPIFGDIDRMSLRVDSYHYSFPAPPDESKPDEDEDESEA